MNKNPCLDCDCYDPDMGCTMPGTDRWYACPLESPTDLDLGIGTCESCSHFIGGGDWGLCCDLKYGLCYENTLKCDKWEFKERRNDNG